MCDTLLAKVVLGSEITKPREIDTVMIVAEKVNEMIALNIIWVHNLAYHCASRQIKTFKII